MTFTQDLQCPEGPVALKDGSWLVVEGGERGRVTHISPDGQQKRTIAKTGLPNGLAIDSEENIWVAEPKTPSLLCVTMQGEVTVFITECNGESFLYPNDLCFGPDGALYLTDSGILMEDFEPNGKIRPDYVSADMDGRVYRIDIKTRYHETGLRDPLHQRYRFRSRQQFIR